MLIREEPVKVTLESTLEYNKEELERIKDTPTKVYTEDYIEIKGIRMTLSGYKMLLEDYVTVLERLKMWEDWSNTTQIPSLYK